ncbi:Tudor domain-containing protein 1 [Argiope bruennichi]|uniref:Tudor domain-containing protein 1 n=1 Tax=Argiope bruennichi TaxID=94029 RepID=A0A8T0E7L2_ARGBR|nr:Tudor domain-containing protein 1 [Argiope bruennichi]
MSFSELENWNPMADDYANQSFNSYTDLLNPHIDPKSLYIKSIPATLTKEAFLEILTRGGKKIKRHLLYPAKPNMNVTCGLVTYYNERDALDTKSCLNGKPPFYWKIEYALNNTESKKNESPDQKNPDIKGRGRGCPVVSEASSGKGHSVSSGTSSLSRLAAVGRGRAAALDPVHSLTVCLQGGQRIAYKNSESGINLRESAYDPDMPKLISSQCLFCKKKGELSCEKCGQTYCSVNCQHQDWPNHKSLCKSLFMTNLKQNQFANDSSYMSEGSSSDNEKKMIHNVSINQPVNRNQSIMPQYQAQDVTSAKPRASPNRNSDNAIQRKFIKITEIQEQKLSLNKQYKVSVSKICSPSNFWVHLDGAEKVLYQMEKEMTSLVQKIPVKCAVGDVCCTFEEGKFLRVAILKVMPNSSIAKYIDYGGTSDLSNNKLYFLPQILKKYHAQAVCCNLVDGMSHGNVSWNEEEISSFKYHTKNKVLMGHVHGFTNNIYNIALMNEDGVSLYSILKAGQMEELEVFSQSKNSLTTIPSVLSNLKKGDEVTVGSVQFEEDTFWGFLENGSRTKVLKELRNCLQNVDTEDISLTCEEGDIAVGFSPSLNQFYRCIVLKRLRNCFLVRYIDYGNTERITKLQSISPMLLQKKSYVICCKKPTMWSIDDMKRVFEATRLVTVKTVNSMSAELSFSYKNGPVVICCYPWYHGTTIAPLTNSASSTSSSNSSKSLGPKSNIRCSQSPRQKISLPPKKLPSKAEIPPKSVITKDLISDKALNEASMYEVNIVWMKDVSEIYVQLIEDEDAIEKLSLNINKYCNSDPCSPYSPIVNEIVCCKFESDSLWYRAQVTGKSKDKCKVFFIDYGNEAEVSINNIKQLPQKFAVPKLSFCVSLYKIKNEDMNKELLDKFMKEKWSMKVLKNSKQQTPTEVMLYLKGIPLTEIVGRKNHSKTLLQFQELPAGISDIVISYHEVDKIYVQQLKDLQNLLSLQTKIESLVKTDVSKPEIGNVYCCLSSDGCWYRGLVKEISSKSILVNYIDFGNDENVSINNLKELPGDLFSHPVYCVPIAAQNSKPKFNPETIFSVEVIGKKDGVQSVKFLSIPQNAENPKLYDLKKLSLEEGVNEVKISFCEKEIFFCHLKNHFSDFDALVKKLTEAKLEPLQQAPAKDDLVCAKSSDGCWYRASVQNISEKDLKYKVFFIDYGNCEDVTFENIQCLSKDLLDFPVFCVPVKILNIEKAKSDFDWNSVFSVKTVGFSNDNVQLVELILPSKAVLPKLNSLKKQLLPTDKEIKVSVCSANDKTFYVQLTSSKELLTTLEAKLMKAAEFKDLSDLPEIGDVICAKYNKDIWCRGSVEKVFAEKQSCEICFIDYGNYEVISLENMKFLPILLCTFPVLSVPVKFRNIEKLQEIAASVSNIELIDFPVRVIDSSDETFTVDIAIPEDDIQIPFIESEMLPESPVEVVTVYQEDDVFYVQRVSNAEKLQEMTIDLQDPIFLKKLLSYPKVGELCNVKHDGQFYRAVIKEQICENKFKVFFVDYGNLDVVESASIYCIPPKYSSVPGLCTAIKFDELVDVKVLKPGEIYIIKYTGISNDNVHVVKLCLSDNKVPVSSIKQNNFDKIMENANTFEKTADNAFPIIDNFKRYMLASLTQQRLPLNELRNVIFYHQEDDIFFLQEVNDTPLVVDVQTEVRRHASSDPLSHNPVIGELLCARSEADGSWYRCCVEEMVASETWRIRFIDYGNDEIVIRENLRSFIGVLAMYPSFAIPVRIIDSECAKSTVELGKVYSVVAESSEGTVQLVKLMLQDDSHTPSENIPSIDNNTNSEVTEMCHNPSDSEISSVKELYISTNTNPEDKYFYSTTDYVQFPDGEQDIIIYSVNEECLLFCAPFNPDAIKANLELAGEITEYCENLEISTFNRHSLPEWDELVLAKYDEDKQWYRAVIVDNQFHPFYDVIFVDYGNAERVSIDSIRKMEKDFMSLPIQTHLCSITGFTINPNSLLNVIQELNTFGVSGNGIPLKASVTSEGEEKFVNIPEITEHLLEKKLVTVLKEE